MSGLPEFENLAVCDEHGVTMHAKDERRACPLCRVDIGVEVRREDDIGDQGLKAQEVRQRIEAETMAELLPLMQEYVEDRFDGELWVTVERFDGKLPAGYTEAQERWVNVIGYRSGAMANYVVTAPAAKETIESLRDNGYGGENDA